jgi:cytochrome c-type biogenesis protein CcmE
MLHLVMDVKRHNPPKENRAPGVMSPEATQAYEGIVRQIFQQHEVVIAEGTIDKAKLQEDLNLIIARRRKYYPDEES